MSTNAEIAALSLDISQGRRQRRLRLQGQPPPGMLRGQLQQLEPHPPRPCWMQTLCLSTPMRPSRWCDLRLQCLDLLALQVSGKLGWECESLQRSLVSVSFISRFRRRDGRAWESGGRRRAGRRRTGMATARVMLGRQQGAQRRMGRLAAESLASHDAVTREAPTPRHRLGSAGMQLRRRRCAMTTRRTDAPRALARVVRRQLLSWVMIIRRMCQAALLLCRASGPPPLARRILLLPY